MSNGSKSVVTEAFKCTFRLIVQKWKLNRSHDLTSDFISHQHIVDASHVFLKRMLQILETHLKKERASSPLSHPLEPEIRALLDLEKCRHLSQQVLRELESTGQKLSRDEMHIFNSVFKQAMTQMKSKPCITVTH